MKRIKGSKVIEKNYNGSGFWHSNLKKHKILDFIRHKTSPNQWLSLIIPLTVRVQELIKIVRFSMKGGIL